MIIAYHSVLILDKEITIVLMCPERIPAIVHPPPREKKEKIVSQCHIKISKLCLKIVGMICYKISFKPSL